MLTRENLVGMWAGLPVPCKEDGSFDEGTFRRDVAACCEAGIPGIYTGGTTGEFYAQSYDEFTRIVDALLDEVRGTNVLTQVGATATYTRGGIERARYALDGGADGIQVALPFWLRLTDEECVGFFGDIAEACPGAPIVHYNTERSKRRLGAAEYRAVLERCPDLMGCKFAGSDLASLTAIVEGVPEINVFVGEPLLASGMMLGAKGCYSSQVYLNPRVMLEYFRLCRERRWAEALTIQGQIGRFHREGLKEILEAGLMDSAIDRAIGNAAGFLECGLECRKPYRSVTEAQLRNMRRWLSENLPEFMRL